MVSEREIEAAREAWREYWCEEDVPRNTRDGMTAALSAAARVRAEANAGEPVATSYIEVTDPALMEFAEWFRRNYPGPDTIIHKPDWHAPKIFRAAIAAARAHPAPQPSGAVVTDDMANAALDRSSSKDLSLLTNTEAMREIIKAALTASKPEQAVSSGWQPIETAPADGRVILVYEARSAYPIHLRSADGDWWRKQGVGPSHWMPLPAAPTAGGGDE